MADLSYKLDNGLVAKTKWKFPPVQDKASKTKNKYNFGDSKKSEKPEQQQGNRQKVQHGAWQHINLKGKRPGVSICISAYDTVDYIEDCIQSVVKQTYFENGGEYEIILAIDHCEKTLKAVKEFKNKYDNLRVLYLSQNNGTYIATNTAMNVAKYDYLIRFDSDDLMAPNMVETLFKFQAANNYKFDYVNFMLTNFLNEFSKRNLATTRRTVGQVMITKQMFKDFGGYQPWRCEADTELLKRSSKLVKQGFCPISLMYRRIRKNALTRSADTGYYSEYRKKLKEQTKVCDTMEEARLKLTVARYVEI